MTAIDYRQDEVWAGGDDFWWCVHTEHLPVYQRIAIYSAGKTYGVSGCGYAVDGLPSLQSAREVVQAIEERRCK